MPATKVRPGREIKRHLTENPGGCSISDMHHAYKDAAAEGRKNNQIPGIGTIRQMGYEAFRRLVYMARKLGFLIEVGRRPIEESRAPQALEKLSMMNVDGGDELVVVPSQPILYDLTPAGEAAVNDWESLVMTYRRQVGTLPEPPRAPLRIPDYQEPASFRGGAMARRFMQHLEALLALAGETEDINEDDTPELADELERLAIVVGVWIGNTSEDNEERIEGLESLQLELEGLNLREAIDALEELMSGFA